MTVIRLELDVPDDRAAELANNLVREYVSPDMASPAPRWRSARVTILTGFEVQREQALLAAARYFYPRGSHDDDH